MRTQEKKKPKLHFSIQVVIGLGLGVFAGLLLQRVPEIANTYIKPFGTVYLNGIRMLIVPLVFSSLVVGTCGIGDIKKFGRIGAKTFVYYMGTTTIAVFIGILLANVTGVGHGLTLATDVEATIVEAPSFVDTIVGIIPANPLQSLVNGDMLQIIVFAIFIGAGIVICAPKAQSVAHFFEGLAEVMYAVTGFVMKFTPYAVFALICPVIATNGPDVLLPLLSFVLVVYAGLIIHTLICYCPSVKLLSKMSLKEFFGKAAEPAIIAMSTCSSSATVPSTLRAAQRMGVPLSIRSFVIPLGATVNMDGGALYQGVTAIFVASLFGINLSISQQVFIVMTAVLASIGTAGVPGASIIMLSVVLSSVGLPLEGVAIVAGVDKLIDMPRTAVNILGDLSAATFVAKSEGELNPELVEIDEITELVEMKV